MPAKGWKGKRVDKLARHSVIFHQQQWQDLELARLTLDDQIWSVRTAQVWLLFSWQLSERTYWLIVTENEKTGEVKYFISNALPTTSLEQLVQVAFRRARVEHASEWRRRRSGSAILRDAIMWLRCGT